MINKYLRIISLILVLVLTIQMSGFFEVAVYANETSDEVMTDPIEEFSTEPEIIGEDISKREETVKHFRVSDGTWLAVSYADAVHYRSSDGSWLEIDNTLQTNTLEISVPIAAMTGESEVVMFAGNVPEEELATSESVEISAASYVNTANSFGVSLPGILNDQSWVGTFHDGYSLYFRFEDIGNASAILPSDTQTLNTECEIPAATYVNTNSSICYNDVLPGVDVVYELIGQQLKENILFDALRNIPDKLSFVIWAEDLELDEQEDGSFVFSSDSGPQFYIPAPFMMDSDGESSGDVEVAIEEISTNTYRFTYTLDQEWLRAEDRVWPVILDPVTCAEMSRSQIQDTYIRSGYPQNGYSLAYYFYTGYFNSASRNAQSFIQHTSPPILSSGDVVIKALYSATGRISNGTSDMLVNAHAITSEWDEDYVSGANFPQTDSTILDYQIIEYDVNRTYKEYTWDITSVAQKWYSGNNALSNFGIMLRSPDAETAAVEHLAQFYAVNGSGSWPVLLIAYRNASGLEGYWDYTSASAGRAGTAFVHNYTGNLVVSRTDMVFGGSLMPASLTFTYNANDHDVNIGYGYGWRSNYSQTIEPIPEVSPLYYKWMDEDGTAHYFFQDSSPEGDGRYVDEDGLELTLSFDNEVGVKYTISDKYGNKRCFDSDGRLIKLENNQLISSSININYANLNSLLISEITDGEGKRYSFTYNTDGNLEKISYWGSGTTEVSHVNYTYDDSLLMTVTYKDDLSATYGYTTDQYLSTLQNIDGYRLTYSYNSISSGKPGRVCSISEIDENVEGEYITIEYGQNQTIFTDFNGNKQIHQFNSFGNTISIQDTQGRAQYAQYAINHVQIQETSDTENGAASDGESRANQLSFVSRMQNTVCNMLDNSSFEVATDWTPISQAVTGTVSSDEAYIGTKSLKMERAGDGDSSGFQSQEISLPKGETYTFSGYVKTVGGKACLVLTNGTHSEYSMYLPKNSDWTRLEVSYTNDTATAINIYARVETENAGTTYLDCVQLEHTPTASRYNLIQNGDFSRNTDWSYSEGLAVRLQLNDDTDAPKVLAPQLDGNVYKMTGVATRTNRITQTVAVSGKAGDTFIIAGWGRGNSVPLDMDDTNPREFAILATFNYTDGTTQTKSAKFNPYVSNWQHASEYLVAEKNFSSITVELAYDYNANAAWYDGIQLFREEFGIQYDYTDGNITSITDILGQKTTYTYYPNNVDVQTATSYVNDTAVTTTYEYDSYHNVISSTSSATPGLSYSYSYDDYGRLESTTVTYGGVSITSETSETIDNQNRLVTATDPAGNTTTYVYDKDTNVLKSVHYPNDGDDASRNIIYGYDSMCRLTSVSKVLSENVTLSVAYEYELDMLTEIETGSTAYTFDYGSFGLRHSIQIGERTLATYGYTERTNYLSSLDYGNGDSVDYMYDTQGRLTRQTYEDGDTVTYAYDNSGYLASVMDSDSGITTRYHYDFADRLVMFTDGNSDFSRRVQFFYNERNQLVTKSEFYGDVRHNTYYNYDRNGRQTMVGTSLSQRRFAYDGFSRLSQRTSTYNGTAVLTETFGYDSGNRISTLTKLLVDDGVSSTVTHSYTYDGNGNITSVTVGDESTRYTYDSANQLIREDNPYTEKTYVWTYDNAGNITSRKEYAYTDGTLGAVQDTVDYTYGDANWGDLLKAYDGEIIAYDEIGNPTSYYNGTRWTMTWEHGRELRTISNGSTTWTNTYDANGLRTKRTNGTTTYRYRYTDGLLATMNIDDDVEMWFMYDGNGPMVIKYGNALSHQEYHYELNLQGDVVAIISTSGERVVEYTYDAWGNVIDITGSAKDTIGVHNPLRYRGYVYDTETGFYYLQSRYYDPELGRFLNADALVSTGQGILGNNMFAYCGNNPVNCVDPQGYIWYYLIVDHDMGFVHRMVQVHIGSTSSSNIRAELVLTGFGRADIVDTKRGVVWEVKHAGKNPEERRAEARNQATGYIGGEQKGVVITGLGEANAFSGMFYVKCDEYYFLVEYNTPEAGVILYSVKEAKKPNLSSSVVYVYVPKAERNQSSSTHTGLIGGIGLGICAIAFPDTGNQALVCAGG